MAEKPDTSHFRKLESLYASAPCNAAYGPKMKIDAGVAEVAVPVTESMFHAARAVHGSYYFKVLDDACFFAAASLVPRVMVLTVSFNVDFMLGVTEGVMTAKASVNHFGKRLIFANATAYDRRKREIARGSGVFVRSNVLLKDVDGYG